MKVILLVFLSLLTSAGTTRKFISPDVALPGDYLEEEKEEDDDDGEKNTDVEQSPDMSARTTVSQLDDGEDLLKKSMQKLQEKYKFITKGAEEDISQEEQALESRFGPHYLTTLTQSHNEELPLDDPRAKFMNVLSDGADLLQRNIAQETSQEDFKVNVMLAVSCTTLACSLIFMICCCMAFIKYRMEKGNFCRTFRYSREQQRPASAPYFDPLRGVPDSSVSRAVESSLRGEKTASDIQGNSKSKKSEILPIISSVVDIPPISHASSLSSIPSYEDLNGDHN